MTIRYPSNSGVFKPPGLSSNRPGFGPGPAGDFPGAPGPGWAERDRMQRERNAPGGTPKSSNGYNEPSTIDDYAPRPSKPPSYWPDPTRPRTNPENLPVPYGKYEPKPFYLPGFHSGNSKLPQSNHKLLRQLLRRGMPFADALDIALGVYNLISMQPGGTAALPTGHECCCGICIGDPRQAGNGAESLTCAQVQAGTACNAVGSYDPGGSSGNTRPVVIWRDPDVTNIFGWPLIRGISYHTAGGTNPNPLPLPTTAPMPQFGPRPGLGYKPKNFPWPLPMWWPQYDPFQDPLDQPASRPVPVPQDVPRPAEEPSRAPSEQRRTGSFPWPIWKPLPQPRPQTRNRVRVAPGEAVGLSPRPQRVPPRPVPPAGRVPPGRNTKERKPKWLKALDTIAGYGTEFADFVGCLYRALPKKRQRARNFREKMWAIYTYADEITMHDAMMSCYSSQGMDRGWGMHGKALNEGALDWLQRRVKGFNVDNHPLFQWTQ